jgi:glycosyltransferase involved in cell wall biosynthesis
VITYHSDVVRQRALGMALRPFEHLVFRLASAILCSSPLYAAGSSFLKHYANVVRVLPFGIELQRYLNPTPAATEHARRMRSEFGEPLWLSVGRLVYYKGLHNALSALRTAPGRLMVIGEGPLADPLRRQAEELGVGQRVIWRGRAEEEELIGAYHAATALWFPSNARSEAFGFAQVEAMASGCPVINTQIPNSGVPWVSQHNQSGLTVAPDDPPAFAAAAKRLLDDPGLRDRLAQGGRARACQHFADAAMAKGSLEVYQQILQRRPASHALQG